MQGKTSTKLWDIDQRGFLPSRDPLVRLTHASFTQIEDFAHDLPYHISGGAVQTLVKRLPLVEEETLEKVLTKEEELERAMLLYCMIAHAYINGECGGKLFLHTGTNRLPTNISRPWYWVSQKLVRPPILSYASIVLYNWKLLDKEKGIELDNVTLVNRFLGIVDEEWFFKVHVVIEAKAAVAVTSTKTMLALIQQFPENSENTKQQIRTKIASEMEKIIASLQQVNKILVLLSERCDPYIFYNALRSFLSSFTDGTGRRGGLIFCGVKGDCPMKFTGASGAQSSILPTLDTFLGIKHDNEPLVKILNNLVAYMPVPHRDFLKTIPYGILRSFVESEKKFLLSLPSLYDAIIEEIVCFRKKHLGYAAKFIVQQVKLISGPLETGKKEVFGTGGAPFMRYLTQHLKETKRSQLGFRFSQTARVIGLLKDVHGLLPEWVRGPGGRVMDLEPQFEEERRSTLVLIGFLFLSMLVLIYAIIVSLS